MSGTCIPLRAVEVHTGEGPEKCSGRSPQPWRILAPVHPGESPETLLRLHEIAETLSGELTTLSVIDGFWPENGHRDEFRRDVVLHGDPASRIPHYASLMHPDLILMPSRPARFGMRFWQRSVVADILPRTDHAVMVVPVAAEWAASHGVRTVLCVVQLDGTDDPVIDRAAAIALRTDSDLTLLHVVPEVNEGTLFAGIEPFDAPLSHPLASERMDRLEVPCRSHCVEIRTGGVHRNIAAVARELRADLVVTQRSRRRRNCPSIGRLQRYVSCPVLSVASADCDLLALTEFVPGSENGMARR